MLRFKEVMADGDGGYMSIGPKQNNGDFDWWPVLIVKSVHDYPEFKANWIVTLVAVSPSEAGEENLRMALESLSMEPDDTASDVEKVGVLAEYGVSCSIWESTGNNLRVMVKEARQQAELCCMLTGF